MPDFSKKNPWKTKRRIMHTFKLDEISAVDVPAQEGARIVMVKRAPDAPEDHDALSFAKVSFQQALEDEKMDRKFSDAFFEAFDGLWTLNDALRQALKDRFQDSEKAVEEYVAEVTALARQAAAATSDFRKAKDDEAVSIFVKAVAGAARDLSKKQENIMPNIKTKDDLVAAIAKFEKDGGTNDDINSIVKAANDLGATSELPESGALATANDLAALKAANERRDSLDAMSDDVRKHFDGLNEDDQTAFLAKSADEQKAEVEQLNADDPVVYTTKSGIAIRKSEGSNAVAMAKQLDSQAATIEKLEKGAEDSRFDKAVAEYPHLPEGTVRATLKAAEGMSDEDANELKKGLKLSNQAAAGAFNTFGEFGKSAEQVGAQEELDNLVKAYVKEHDVDEHVALGKVLETEKGAQLYDEIEGQVQVQAD